MDMKFALVTQISTSTWILLRLLDPFSPPAELAHPCSYLWDDNAR